MLEARNLNFKYMFDRFRIDNVSLAIEKGYVYALTGSNGAGKTTLLRLLYGALTPRSGEVLWKGEPVNARTLAKFRSEVALVGIPWCDSNATVEDNAEMYKTLYPVFDDAYWETLLRRMKLWGTAHSARYGALSAGEANKIDIAFALARRPELLILDEPLANLDPVFKTEITELLREAVATDGLTVLMTTNLVDEIRGLADYFGVIRDGSLVKWGENCL